MYRTMICAVVLTLVGLVSTASAHYLWVAVSADANGKSTANIYFEEGPGPGTGEYLDPIIATGKTWLRTIEQPEPKLLTTRDVTDPKSEAKKRWLTTELSGGAPRSVDSYGKFGVYRYGQTDVLLHYYARFLDVDSHEDLHELARAKQMRLDLVPHDHDQEVELTVLWDDKPAAGCTVYVRGPKGWNKNLKTDDQGEAHFTPEHPGRYTIRTFVELNEAGREGDKEYSLIRHHATLVMNLPLKK